MRHNKGSSWENPWERGQKVEGGCANEDHKVLPFTCVVTIDHKGLRAMQF